MKFTFLDGERNLRYSIREIKQIHEKFTNGDGAADRFKQLEAIADVVSIGLKRDDGEMTPEKAADIIDAATLTELFTAIREAIGLGRQTGDGRPTEESSRNGGPSPDMTSGSPTLTSGT